MEIGALVDKKTYSHFHDTYSLTELNRTVLHIHIKGMVEAEKTWKGMIYERLLDETNHFKRG